MKKKSEKSAAVSFIFKILLKVFSLAENASPISKMKQQKKTQISEIITLLTVNSFFIITV